MNSRLIAIAALIILILPATIAVVTPHQSVSLTQTTDTLNADFVLASQDSITYRYAHYSLNGGDWQEFELIGTQLTNNWLEPTATGIFSIPITSTTQDVYVITYTCSLADNDWDCHGNDWQIIEAQVAASEPESPSTTQNAWSNPQTWTDMGQSTPQAGDMVMIPSGERVILDVTPPPLNGIMVRGTLEFADTDLAVTTDYIKVMGSGAELIIGTEAEPIESNIQITLTGTQAEIDEALANDDHCGYKGICSMGGGRLEIIGAYQGPTWTRLADGNTLNPGDNSITLQEPVEWNVGDKIVVTSTDYDPGLAEEFTITSVSSNKKTLGLSSPAQFMHYGEIQDFSGYKLDQRAEVMHLTRNILIQGDQESENTKLGGHMMAMNEHHMMQHMAHENNGVEYVDMWEQNQNDLSIVPKISGVEFYRMGQQSQLARYPWHWHLYGQADGSYVKDSSVHNSYQRCYTIHGTQGVLLEGNVAFNAVGHCYFMEDGAEWDNTLRENIGAVIKSYPSRNKELIISDLSPAVFYWSNPNNDIHDNVAAGAYGFGFHYNIKENPDGPSATTQIDLSEVKKGQWGFYDNNVAHSIAMVGRQDFRDETNMYPGTGIGLAFVNDQKNDQKMNIQCAGQTKHQIVNWDRALCNFNNFSAYFNEHYGAWFEDPGDYKGMSNSTFADNPGDYWNIHNSPLPGNVFIDFSNNLGNPGKAGQGIIGNQAPNSHYSWETQELLDAEIQLGRSLSWWPHHYYPDGQAGDSPGIKSLDPLLITNAVVVPKYDGAYIKDQTIIGYNDKSWLDTGVWHCAEHCMFVATAKLNMIDSTAEYVPRKTTSTISTTTHKIHRPVIRDHDGSMTRRGEYAEVREYVTKWAGEDIEFFYDDTCEIPPNGDARYRICSGATMRAQWNEGGWVTQEATGYRFNYGDVHKAWEFPTKHVYHFESDAGPEIDVPYFSDIPPGHWVTWSFPSSTPYQFGGNAAGRGIDETVNSRAEMDSSEMVFVLYYDAANDKQYIRVNSDYRLAQTILELDEPLHLATRSQGYRFKLNR